VFKIHENRAINTVDILTADDNFAIS